MTSSALRQDAEAIAASAPDVEIPRRKTIQEALCAVMAECSIEGCSRPHAARGWCLMHYKRWRKWGDPLLSAREIEPAVRIWRYIERRNRCWEWTGARNPDGYGKTGSTLAHRVVYELIVGPIPDGMVIDHLCRNRACVNPSHLEPVTNRENVLRGAGPSAVNAAKTYCVNGHPLSVDRKCRPCLAAASRRYRENR